MSELPLLLTIPQVCEQTGIKSKTTVYELISAGQLDTVDIAVHGRSRTRVPRASLERFIERRTAKRVAS